ncbi:MAG: LuxR C-terminal-related transcriptional regulator [Gammaproteobacteria bacterium]
MSNILAPLILKQLPGLVGWKNTKLEYLGANNKLLMAKGLTHEQELIGRSDHDIGVNTYQENELFYRQDLQVLRGTSLEIFHCLQESSDQSTYFLQKSPLYDQKQNIIGLIYYCMVWSNPNLLNILRKIDHKYQSGLEPNYYTTQNHPNPAGLSNRELECLFLQLRGQTAKQIAELLGLSKRTIEYYLENTKAKLGCLNKAELLVVATQQGYHNYIPKSFTQSTLISYL